MARETKVQPTWKDVKSVIKNFDREGLQGLVQDLYSASKSNQSFLHVRLNLGTGQLKPFKDTISRWINPDIMLNQPISVAKSKKAIAEYRKAIGRPEGMAELSIFYCEEAFDFLESCGMDDEGYFLALIRMYDQETVVVQQLGPDDRTPYVERLNNLQSRASSVGWGVGDELTDIWLNSGLEPDEDL